MASASGKPPTCTSKLGTCSVCRTNKARYTCPACGVRSCSLSCVKSHKKCEGCDGIRNKASLVLKDDMDNLTILSDYRFVCQEVMDNLRLLLGITAKAVIPNT